MPRPILLGFLVCGLFLPALTSKRGDLMLLSLPLLAYLLTATWPSGGKLELAVERALSARRAPALLPVSVTVTVRNSGPGIDQLLVEDHPPSGLRLLSGAPRHLVSLPRGAAFSFSYRVEAARGRHVFERIDLTASDSLGLSSRRLSLASTDQLVVLPAVTRLEHISVRPRRTRISAGSVPARAGGAGIEFYGVRSYAPGDSSRVINWRISARRPDEIFSNEFQQERSADVGIVLDGRERTNLFGGGNSLFENGVSAAAALSDAFLRQGNRVGLLVYGSYLGWSPPGYGSLQRERILTALASAQVGASPVFSALGHLSARMFPPDSQIVLVSSLAHDDLKILVSLRARGYQVLVISPEPVSFEMRTLPGVPEVEIAARIRRLERRVLLRSLQRAGVQVIGWDVLLPMDQAIRPALARLRSSRLPVRVL